MSPSYSREILPFPLRPHENADNSALCFQKSLLWGPFSEICFFGTRNHRLRVDRRLQRRKKNLPFQKYPGAILISYRNMRIGQIRRSRALQILSVDETKKTSNIVVLLVLLGKTKRHQSFWPALLLNMQETCANHRLKRLILFFQSFSWPELFYPCNPNVKSRLVCFFSSFKI